MRSLLPALLVLLATAAHAADLLAPGDPFPAWTLSDQDGRTIGSASLQGKTYLLWFYPKAMTPGCTAEGQGLRDRWVDFQRMRVEVFGVSFDPPEANAEFKKTEQFPFSLLSDRDRSLAVVVGAAGSTDASVARRISYLVGPDGKVKQVYGTVVPATHAGDVLGHLVAP